MAIKIVADSTCDISKIEQQELGIDVVPLHVIFDAESYLDGETITATEFYKKQEQAKILPKTSQPNPSQFQPVFQKAIDNGDEVICIVISSKLSGTYSSALLARKSCTKPENIHIVDSVTATVTMGLLVREAVKKKNEGATVEEVLLYLQNIIPRIQFVAFFGNLKYLKMGGRISASTAILGSMLSITPIISVAEGKFVQIGKVRGFKQITAFTKKFIEEHPIDDNYPVMFAHSNCAEKLEQFKNACKAIHPIVKSHVDMLGATVTCQCGPGCFGIGYVSLT